MSEQTRDMIMAQYWVRLSMYHVFTPDELRDIAAAAAERGRSVHGVIHDAVMEALYR